MFSKKKKHKISEEEAFDSLLFPFTIDIEDEDGLSFKYSSGGGNIKLRVFSYDKNYEPVYNGGVSFIHVFSKNNENNNISHEYALVIKDFLEHATNMSINLDKNRVCYLILVEYNNFQFTLSFIDSDMYPSVANYIISKTSKSIYKNAVKGNK